MKITKSKVGKNAYQVSKVWKLGFHVFLNGEDLVLRICYLRNEKGTHYVQMSIKVREELDCANS